MIRTATAMADGVKTKQNYKVAESVKNPIFSAIFPKSDKIKGKNKCTVVSNLKLSFRIAPNLKLGPSQKNSV